MDPDWVDVFLIEHGNIPARYMLVYQRLGTQKKLQVVQEKKPSTLMKMPWKNSLPKTNSKR